MTLDPHRQTVLSVMSKLGLLEGRPSPEEMAGDLLFADLGMDSLTVLDLCVALEDQTGCIVEPADLVQHPSVDALARFLEARVGPQG